LEGRIVIPLEMQRVHFGSVDKPPANWREDPEVTEDEDPDDELLDETPEDVVEMLGFDPLELEDGKEETTNPTKQAAVSAALESVETTDEARAILKTLEQYP
jgi:hypothetical protein